MEARGIDHHRAFDSPSRIPRFGRADFHAPLRCLCRLRIAGFPFSVANSSTSATSIIGNSITLPVPSDSTTHPHLAISAVSLSAHPA